MKYQIKIDEEKVYLIINNKLTYEYEYKEHLTNKDLFSSIYPEYDKMDVEFLENYCCDIPLILISKISNETLSLLDFNDKESDTIEEDFILTFNETIQSYLGLDEDWEPILYEPPQIKDNGIYLILNKPQGYVTSTKDPDHKTVMELLKEYKNSSIFPVGRLDIDSTGLLLFTNDGKLSDKLLSPKNHVEKTYEIKTEKELSLGDINTLQQGIYMDDSFTKPCKINKINKFIYHITISEGRYHQVKRMLLSVNNKVLSLNRIKFGPLELKNLKLGEYRLLTKQEIDNLRNVKR